MTEVEEEQLQGQEEMADEYKIQQLRSKGTELLLREEWNDAVIAYSQFINLCENQLSMSHDHPQHTDHVSKLKKSLCLALSNRAEAYSKLREFTEALEDCDQALKIETTHFKTLLCKGKIFLNLSRYSMALDCFKKAQLDPQASGNCESLNGYLKKCKKLESLSKSGAFDLSDWVIKGFKGKPPELAEYIGPVQVRKSTTSGRGLFATKNIDVGTILFITKAISIERAILLGQDQGEKVQLVMWKNFIDSVMDSVTKCSKTHNLVSILSSGEDQGYELQVPDMGIFGQEANNSTRFSKLDGNRVLSILDVNSLVEDSISAKVLGKNSDYYGIGLWVLASFLNHSCIPNTRRLHVGDYVIVHASRDVKAGEELTIAYFDVLSPLDKRKDMMLKSWGFDCICKRCKYEEEISSMFDMKEIEIGIERGMDVGVIAYKLEEGMRRWTVRGREKGYLRASFWAALCEAYGSEKLVKRWGRRLPPIDSVVDSISEVVGSDERVLKILLENLKRGRGGIMEMERALNLGRGIYGKVVKKQTLRSLLDISLPEPSY